MAVFPYECGNDWNPLYSCQVYHHVGQHGSADYSEVISATRAATPGEYADLANELRRIGYNLSIVTRRHHGKAAAVGNANAAHRDKVEREHKLDLARIADDAAGIQ